MKKWLIALVVSLVLIISLIGLVAVQRSIASGPPFSDKTLNGDYIFSLTASSPAPDIGGPSGAASVAGVAMFDGAGNVTSGSLFQVIGQSATRSVSCSATFSGTYSIDSAGNLQLELTFTPGDGCTGITTRHFFGAVTHNGHEFVFAQNDPSQNDYSAGVGVEQ